MKLGVPIYYKNLNNYPQSWVSECLDSIYSQTYRNFQTKTFFKVYTLDYSDNPSQPLPDTKRHFQQPLPNYADAMNFIYEKVFQECDVVANVNIDDYYDERRFELLMQTIEDGADIASSNYILFNDEGVIRKTDFAKLDVKKELLRGNNIVSNPCHLMRREVFEKIKFDSSLVPKEDLAYWQRAVKEGFKIVIRPEYLHYYRIHQNQMGNVKTYADVC